jgi:hypothetical protein
MLKGYRIETLQVLQGVKAVKLSVADLEKQRKAMNIPRNIAVNMVKEVEETSLNKMTLAYYDKIRRNCWYRRKCSKDSVLV